MAGIGFELKKLFSEEEELPFANLRAIIFSIIVSVGPWLITATSLNIIIWISNQIELARPKQLIFTAALIKIRLCKLFLLPISAESRRSVLG